MPLILVQQTNAPTFREPVNTGATLLLDDVHRHRPLDGLHPLALLMLGLAHRAQMDNISAMVEAEINWPEALRATDNSSAVNALRSVVLNGLRIALRERTDVSEAQLEDFTQEALLRILQRLEQFAGRSKFTTWAHSIAINTAFAELRRKRWRDVSLDALAADGHQLSEQTVMPDNALGDEDDRARLITALRRAVAERLSDKQRTIIVCVLQEMPFDQIVELLGTNRNSAYKLLHDARCALKRHLIGEGITSEDIRISFGL